MRIHTYAILLLLLSIFPLKLLAQNNAQSSVVDQINLGVKYLSEKEYIKSIEELIEAKEIALRNEWYAQAFNATINIGTNYFLMLDYGEAFRYYLKAYEIAIKHLGKSQEMAVVNNIGILYVEEKDLPKAKESFFKAYEIAKDLDDNEIIGTYGINLALVLNKMGELDQAEKYIEEALPILKIRSNVLLLAKIAKAENLFLREQYVQAERLALDILPQINNLSLINEGATVNDKITLLLLISKIYEKQKQFKKAQKYVLMARAAQLNIEERIESYGSLADLYGETNEFHKAMAYKDSVLLATDSLYAIKNMALFKSEKVKFQIQNYQNELLESKKLLKQEKQFFYTLIFSVILIMGFLLWIYKNNSLKHKQRKRIVELELAKEKSDHLLIEEKHREKVAMELLEKERLKNELDIKNRELTAKAMYLASRNELIEEVVQSLSINTQITTNTPLKNQVNDLKKHLKKDTQWDSFFVHFEELNQGFLDRLRSQHPKLTPNDIRFLTFLYMNLSNKEIASLLNITPESCRKRKERISKKMNVPEGLPLHAYLSAI
ncbi:tetratricopeptide repeat protein [Aequorivita marisscotiae]|uniref:Tetratricopeptide repeat protein n=1 Tax=Aequorivita marisscotiae TaxID=3040348 RepID=A0ABY8KQF0_9FLAO|nr:tetratricopeptide repeat protein [Aequorivita sp. Ant34-E75]WGF91695.1 tetratricopeptide repeat protein [Aequorivita sp. Ant34-E75]